MTILQAQKTYEPLNVTSAVALAIELGLISKEARVNCSEIGDGNLNLVFHISEVASDKSFIIKQALPFARVVGESMPLTIKRATIEAEALKLFRDIAPDFVPEVYFSDETLAVTVMEDLSHLKIARKGLIDGEEYPLISAHLGEYVAKTLFATSDYGLEPAQKKELVQKFINPELCKITEDLVLTDPFFDAPSNDFEEELLEDVQKIWNDQSLKLEVAWLKKSFLTETEALLHGDLHTGSVFASPLETKVIDPEFAYYGPAGFDLGQVIANLLFQAIARPEKSEAIYTHIETFWNVFVEQYTALWNTQNKEPFSKTDGYRDQVIDKFFKDAIGFAGCELIRRTIGLSHVADLDGISDKENRLNAKQYALTLGRKLIVNRKQFSCLDEFVTSLRTS